MCLILSYVIDMSIQIHVKLGMSGNSLKMTVPVPARWALKWEKGDLVKLEVENNKLVVSKAS